MGRMPDSMPTEYENPREAFRRASHKLSLDTKFISREAL